MIHLKSPQEIEIMKRGGAILRKTVDSLVSSVTAGITTLEIDNEAQRRIRQEGADISFNKVPGYDWATCLPVNDQVVHTPPGSRKLKNGDVLTIDIGVFFEGFHTDYATTFVVGGGETPEVRSFLAVGKQTLDQAIAGVAAGKRIGDISAVIEDGITGAGYFIMKELTGHGIGRGLHEEPLIPGYREKPVNKTPIIQPGLVIAVEVIYAMGTGDIRYDTTDHWSIASADGSLTGCFEKTIAITAENTFLLT